MLTKWIYAIIYTLILPIRECLVQQMYYLEDMLFVSSVLFETHGQLIGGAAGYFYLFKTKNIIIKNKK